MADPWSETFELMWQAYTAGTIPVGAVVTDAAGEIVARGRNRIFDEASGRELGRTRLAHAEVNALAALSSERRYEGYTLWSTLEPCHVCLAGAIAVRVGTVRFAASDPYAGATGKLLPSPDHLAHPLRVEGPLPGREGRLPALLHVRHFLWRRPDGDVLRFYGERYPDVLEAAAALPAPDAGASLADALAAV